MNGQQQDQEKSKDNLKQLKIKTQPSKICGTQGKQ